MKNELRAILIFLVLFPIAVILPAHAEQSEQDKVKDATQTIADIRKAPDYEIPEAVLKGARGIAVIPGVIKLGFFVGGRYGKGVFSVLSDSGEWSDPVFISLASGSYSWQFGVQSTDLILVFKSKRSIEAITQGKFTLGADASIAAGPVGRNTTAGTDIELKAEIYSYSRSRGFFAGISLDGSALQIDQEADAAFYGNAISASDIMAGKAPKTPAEAVELKDSIRKLMGGGKNDGK
jgi:lipid-binding SYLF domain-containing protein